MPSVSCLATSQTQVDDIVRKVVSDGFVMERISVLFPDPRRSKQLGLENITPMAPGPIVGPGTGMAMGGVLGWVVGLASFAIPGVGLFIAAGPILAALSGGAIGATVGAIAGGLIGMGMPEAQAEYYEEKIGEGRFMIWVDVHNPEEISSIRETFTRHGAEDITLSVEAAEMMDDDTAHKAKEDTTRIQEVS